MPPTPKESNAIPRDSPPVVLTLWDQDKGVMGKTSDYLGRCVIKLGGDKDNKDVASTNFNVKGDMNMEARNNLIPPPKWHDIRMGFDETSPPTGQVLCSFVITDLDFEFQTPVRYLNLNELIPKREYSIDLNILGLRTLKSFGLMPVKKPFIKFDIRSLVPPEKAMSVTNVLTEPSATGCNPNINTTIKFVVELPKEALYCPSLSCTVYDYLFKGFSQPLLGTFTICIGDIKTQTEKEYKTVLNTAKAILRDLKEFEN